jgi:hypothetical protein
VISMDKVDTTVDPAREYRIKRRSGRYLPLRGEIRADILLAFREFVFAATGSRSINVTSEALERIIQNYLESEGIKIESSPTLIG